MKKKEKIFTEKWILSLEKTGLNQFKMDSVYSLIDFLG